MTAFSQFESRLLNETRGLNFIQILMIFLVLWTTMTPLSAQTPKQLNAIHITSMEETVGIFPVKYNPNKSSFVATRFLECRTDTSVIGYILEALPGETMHFENIMLPVQDESQKGGDRIAVGLSEAQRTEQLLVDELNRITDEVHFIPLSFTAPLFYQYQRQYIFYQDTNGDTCVHINSFIPHDGLHPKQTYIVVHDGDDDHYWRASLNLSQGQLITYSIHTPTMHIVKGRCKERFGLSQERVFYRNRWGGEYCQLEQLPQAVQKGILSVIQECDISTIHSFHPKVRRGKRLCELPKDYYMVTRRDGSLDGFDSRGQWSYTDAGLYRSEWKEPYVSEECVPAIGKMMKYIEKDLESRGFDFSVNGVLRSVERVKGHYVLMVECKASLPADNRRFTYTFSKNGHLTGIGIEIISAW